jgi:hypothetical protein
MYKPISKPAVPLPAVLDVIGVKEHLTFELRLTRCDQVHDDSHCDNAQRNSNSHGLKVLQSDNASFSDLKKRFLTQFSIDDHAKNLPSCAKKTNKTACATAYESGHIREISVI